jgi:hypothetical protein
MGYTWPEVGAAVTFPIMAAKQIINVVQFWKASKIVSLRENSLILRLTDRDIAGRCGFGGKTVGKRSRSGEALSSPGGPARKLHGSEDCTNSRFRAEMIDSGMLGGTAMRYRS